MLSEEETVYAGRKLTERKAELEFGILWFKLHRKDAYKNPLNTDEHTGSGDYNRLLVEALALIIAL